KVRKPLSALIPAPESTTSFFFAMDKCKTRSEKNYFTQSTQRKYMQRRNEICSVASAARYFFNFSQRAPKISNKNPSLRNLM
ncbi:MAG TPA: hypothetical protein PLO99_15340, partial [Chitinophagaceae bacterium]|nr:hypothetical protein [Chitinophagaceae bacterium]